MRGTLTVLGSGTSTGVPTLGCTCPVCSSSDVRDQRLRPSIWISYGGHEVVIDTTPDFRQQAFRAGIPALDAVLYTHSHADHIMGMDDVRPFNFNRPDPLPVYASPATLADLRRVFQYVFEGTYTASAIPRVAPHEIQGPVDLFGTTFEPVPVLHGELPVLGFRFGANAYITDVSEIPPSSRARLADLDLLILDALRLRPHPTHFHLESALDLVAGLRPRRTYFTHIAHELAHAATEASLPEGVHLAYDGLRLEIEL
ncbi:MAG: MBL fold metallo-hydrolase [Terriglobales bacterium]